MCDTFRPFSSYQTQFSLAYVQDHKLQVRECHSNTTRLSRLSHKEVIYYSPNVVVEYYQTLYAGRY